MIVLLDANVAITLAIPSSRSLKLLRQLVTWGHVVALSPAILDEVSRNMLTNAGLRKWMALSDDAIRLFLLELPTMGIVAEGIFEIHGEVPDDPNDDHVLAAAQECKASYIIATEDRHLLSLGEWRGIKIRDRKTLLDELAAAESEDEPTPT